MICLVVLKLHKCANQKLHDSDIRKCVYVGMENIEHNKDHNLLECCEFFALFSC